MVDKERLHSGDLFEAEVNSETMLYIAVNTSNDPKTISSTPTHAVLIRASNGIGGFGIPKDLAFFEHKGYYNIALLDEGPEHTRMEAHHWKIGRFLA